METSVVTQKGQIVIPKKIRLALHIKRGTQVHFQTRNGDIILKPLTPAYFEQMAGILGEGGKATKVLLDGRATDRARENR